MKIVQIKRCFCLAGLITLLMFKPVSAQFIGFEILNRSGRTTFAFEKVNNLIIIPVTLNDRLPLNFILDSGVRTTILTDREISDVINISYDRVITIGGAGQIRELNAYLASNVSLSMPGISGVGQSLIVLEEDYLELRSHLGMNVHGIIGYEFFNHFVVRIDYDRKLITVFDPDTFKPGRRFSGIPFTIEQGRPYIYTTITQYDGTVINPKLLIDSGASHGLLLETDTNPEIVLPEERLETIIGWGLGGELSGYLGRVRSLAVDDFLFRDVLVSFTNGHTNTELARATGRNGSVGGELLSRFTVVFDYPGNMLYLRKNRTFSFPFDFNLVGIDILATGSDYNTFRIINVIKDSPAYEAGVRKDDIVLAVNWKHSTDLSITEINNMLRTGSGRKMSLTLFRNDEVIRVSFRLRRLI